MIPDLANMAAQESSMDTVPISITTSRIRSSSEEPKYTEEDKGQTSGLGNWLNQRTAHKCPNSHTAKSSVLPGLRRSLR